MGSRQIADFLAEIQLSEYYDLLIQNGFDDMRTLHDIQESDLDALKFKLGHRRKLQRALASLRGIPDLDPLIIHAYVPYFNGNALFQGNVQR
jgi:hypothetical protein